MVASLIPTLFHPQLPSPSESRAVEDRDNAEVSAAPSEALWSDALLLRESSSTPTSVSSQTAEFRSLGDPPWLGKITGQDHVTLELLQDKHRCELSLAAHVVRDEQFRHRKSSYSCISVTILLSSRMLLVLCPQRHDVLTTTPHGRHCWDMHLRHCF